MVAAAARAVEVTGRDDGPYFAREAQDRFLDTIEAAEDRLPLRGPALTGPLQRFFALAHANTPRGGTHSSFVVPLMQLLRQHPDAAAEMATNADTQGAATPRPPVTPPRNEAEPRGRRIEEGDIRLLEIECPVCLEDPEVLARRRMVRHACGHYLCRGCRGRLRRTSNRCPECRQPLDPHAEAGDESIEAQPPAPRWPTDFAAAALTTGDPAEGSAAIELLRAAAEEAAAVPGALQAAAAAVDTVHPATQQSGYFPAMDRRAFLDVLGEAREAPTEGALPRYLAQASAAGPDGEVRHIVPLMQLLRAHPSAREEGSSRRAWEAETQRSPGVPRTSAHTGAGSQRNQTGGRSMQRRACTCVGRRPNASGRHRVGCPRSLAHNQAQPAAHNQAQPVAHSGDSRERSPTPSMARADAQLWMSSRLSSRDVDDIVTGERFRPPVKVIPMRARGQAALTLALLLREVGRSPQGAAREEAWDRLLAFPKLVLGALPKGRGESMADAIIRRARELRRPGGIVLLYDEARRHRLPPADEEVDDRTASECEPPAAPRPGEAHGLLLEADAPTDAALRRADRLVRDGQVARGVKALSSPPIAPPSSRNAELLRELHPHEEVPDLTGLPTTTERLTVDSRRVEQALRSFGRGAAAGLSGLTADHLLSLITLRGSQVMASLVDVIRQVVDGETGPAGGLLYAAKLVTLRKQRRGEDGSWVDTGKIRPIAIGETLRRVAGKVILAAVKPQLRHVLGGHYQMALGVPGGQEALIHAARTVVRRMSQERDRAGTNPDVFVQLDCTNAFNSLKRTAMFGAVGRYMPALLPHLRAAYGAHTRLHYGRHRLTSASGTQQGDVLSMLVFALTLKAMDEELEAAMGGRLLERVTFFGRYADDLQLAGPLTEVSDLVTAVSSASGRLGLRFNRAKTRVACGNAEAQALVRDTEPLGDGEIIDLDDLEVMGVPVGRGEALERHVAGMAAAATAGFSRIERLADVNAHRASTALTLCGRGVATHVARACRAPLEQLASIDTALVAAGARILGVPQDPDTLAQLASRVKDGGYGLRPLAPYARIAHGASLVETGQLHQLVCSIPRDPEELRVALEEAHGGVPQLADVMLRHTTPDPRQRTHQLQRAWTAQRDAYERSVAPPPSPARAARLASAARSHCGLHPVATADHAVHWLDNGAVTAIARQRLGLPLYPDAGACPLCPGGRADVFGGHAQSCMGGGLHTRAHNAVRDELIELCRMANFGPQAEVSVSDDGRQRIDLLVNSGGLWHNGRQLAIDVAVISLNTARYGAAVREPAGHCTAYEAVKRRLYAEHARRRSWDLVPFVVDTFGSIAPRGEALLREIAAGIQRHQGLLPTEARRLVRQRVQCRLQAHVADILQNGEPRRESA